MSTEPRVKRTTTHSIRARKGGWYRHVRNPRFGRRAAGR